MPKEEGLRTTVFELGRNADNLFEVERRLFNRETIVPGPRADSAARPQLPPLDTLAARIA
jgi:5-methylcytosine-specific restriction enzyme B